MHSGNYIGINKLVGPYAFQLLREVDDTGLAQVAVYHLDQYATLRSVHVPRSSLDLFGWVRNRALNPNVLWHVVIELNSVMIPSGYRILHFLSFH